MSKTNSETKKDRWERSVKSINDSLSKLYLAPSDLHGVGVFTREDIKKGEKLYAGDLPAVFDLPLSYIKQLKKPVQEEILTMFPYVYSNRVKKRKAFLYPPVAFVLYLNHSDKPNYSPVKDTALKDIKAGEEITEDYQKVDKYKDIYKFLK